MSISCPSAFKQLISESFQWDVSTARMNFKTKHTYYPSFSSSWIHGNYVDCVRWYGDLVLSKSVDHRIIMWKQEDIPENPWETGSKYVILMVSNIYQCSCFHCTVLTSSPTKENTILAVNDRCTRIL